MSPLKRKVTISGAPLDGREFVGMGIWVRCGLKWFGRPIGRKVIVLVARTRVRDLHIYNFVSV